MNSLLKGIERGFRRFLLKSLRLFSRPKTALPPGTDFNACKFLFIRQDRIGDVLVSTPLFHALRSAYPRAVIDVLLSTNNAFVLDHDPAIRRRWIYQKSPWKAIPVLRGIRKERYDFVIDLMDNPSATSTLVMLLANGKWNVGLEKENSYAYDIIVPLRSRKETHIIDRLAEILTVFRVSSDGPEFRVRYTTAGESDGFAARVLQEAGAAPRCIGVNISAGTDARFWGIARYRSLLSLLKEHYSRFSLLILHKPSDRKRALEIAEGVPGSVVPPDMSFDQFAALIKRMDLLVTPDTSAVHLASAFSIPSVVLYVQSDRNLRIWEPYRSVCEAVVTHEEDLTAIDVATVFGAIQRVMQRIPAEKDSRSSDIAQTV